MRLSPGVLLCLGLSALCAACAGQPQASSAAATPPPVSAPAPAAAPTAAPAAAAAQATKIADTDEDRHFRAQGYTLKMHDGDKLWCHHEEVLGSRVGGKQVCSTPDQIRQAEQQSKAITESVQRSSMTGCSKTCGN